MCRARAPASNPSTTALPDYGKLCPVCGRYGSWSGDTALAAFFQACDLPAGERLEPSWNIAPTADIRLLINRPDPATPDSVPQRSLRTARWGLLPRWAQDPALGNRAFNARSETAASKPTFREAYRHFRAIIPADCWYEWKPADGPSRPRHEALKQKAPKRAHGPTYPYAVASRDEEPLAFAALASWWRVPTELPDGTTPPRPGPSLHEQGDEQWLLTATILTREASPDLAWLHTREPIALPRDTWDAWLDPNLTDPDAIAPLLTRDHPPLHWWAVGSGVGSPRSNGHHLLEPIGPVLVRAPESETLL